MSVTNHNSKTSHATPSPAIYPSWRFGDLPASELIPKLQQYLTAQKPEKHWQLVWLNNDDRPVIGLLPKVAWSVCFNSNQQGSLYTVTKNYRDDNGTTTSKPMSYSAWQDELITYSQNQRKNQDPDNNIAPNIKIDADKKSSKSVNTHDAQPIYHHGFIGFIGYDIAAHELSPTADIQFAKQPCAVLGHYDIYLTPADENAGWTLRTINPDTINLDKREQDTTELDAIKLDTHHQTRDALLDTLISCLNALDHALSNKIEAPQNTEYLLSPLVLNPRWHEDAYQSAFHKTQDYLQQGDCYQINLTQVWQGLLVTDTVNHTPNLIDYSPALHRNTQAPFAGYLQTKFFNNDIDAIKTDTSKSQFELLSCSPELFFTFKKDASTGQHHIVTKPIKGTMPRGTTAEQDDFNKQQLINSEKDRAENVMIVDLLRNDLGKYAKIGSVKAPQLFAIESFSNVHHMVSTITAELKSDAHPLAVLFGSLPAGSITGTPKKRAVEIISELESESRGAYCGTMGYMNFDGSGQWNVLIRTLQANTSSNGTLDDTLGKEGQVSLWAGGGITVASDCDAEYQECLDKVGNLLSVLTLPQKY